MTQPTPTVSAQGLGVVPGDLLNTYVQTVANFAQLRTFPGLSNMSVNVLGGASPGDGLQGIFYYNASSTAADDNATVIAPTGVATGRWLKLPEGAAPSSGPWFQLETGTSPVKVSAFPSASLPMGPSDIIPAVQGGIDVTFSQRQILTGQSGTSGYTNGQPIWLYGGQGYSTSGNGGDVVIEAGSAANGNGGSVNVAAGIAPTGEGGAFLNLSGPVEIQAGYTFISGESSYGADVNITAGRGAGSGDGGDIFLRAGLGGASSSSSGGVFIYTVNSPASGYAPSADIVLATGAFAFTGLGGNIVAHVGSAPNALESAGYLSLLTGHGYYGSSSAGGAIRIVAGNGGGIGGGITIASGNAGTSGDNGGNITMTLGVGEGAGIAGRLILVNLPTSSAGLPSGAVWNNGGVLNIV